MTFESRAQPRELGLHPLLDLDLERVRVRAYFLAENKSGRKWWDRDSNWLEAETLEIVDAVNASFVAMHRKADPHLRSTSTPCIGSPPPTSSPRRRSDTMEPEFPRLCVLSAHANRLSNTVLAGCSPDRRAVRQPRHSLVGRMRRLQWPARSRTGE